MTAVGGDRPDAVLLMGPTCSGKSDLALALAREFPVEIVSVDSALVYRGMDIGTSKPPAAVRGEIPHHLIDVCDPAEAYSAGRFRRDATALIRAIRGRGRIPLLVGGTMLYFRSLVKGLAPLPEADPALREQIDRRARELGWPALHRELASRDPGAAARIHPTDAQRIQRAIEVLELTGQPLSTLQRQAVPAPYRFRAFALMPWPREELYRRIGSRLDEMMQAGLLDEVRCLYARGDLSPDLPSIRAVGYRQLWAHLAGRRGLEDAVADAGRATRQLAKRQLTWLRSEQGLEWLQGVDDRELNPVRAVLSQACP
ncbi:MAG TPA: tRNA (adenosine(37)-N6)-dimethylallyltransferase MiaA [Steroidobacteraceae bacterium]|nr:tRNA (adenosine(37)-N6)-dimethylallyltransferase MiaA [Steroidobacteraceae bacterium]